MEKRFSQACENNKQPILEHLTAHFAHCTQVLEIGSGTGQHSVYFAQALSHLVWQTSDQPEYHPSVLAYGEEAALTNWKAPLSFTVGKDQWPSAEPAIDAVFSANTAHIMQREEAKVMMHLIAEHLPKDGVFCQYGPFKFDGNFTSESNRDFDASLRERGYGGYRDIDELTLWAQTEKGCLSLQNVYPMPANNHLLQWRKL